jgi:hypothetical protein
MSWVRVSAILAGWTVLPALAWTLAHEALRFGRSLHDWIAFAESTSEFFSPRSPAPKVMGGRSGVDSSSRW